MQQIAERINEALRQPLSFETSRIVVKGSVGGVLSTRRDATLSTLLAAADERLYKAKASGKDSAWTMALSTGIRLRRSLPTEIRGFSRSIAEYSSDN
jgi:GGDEF domain-containing protein